MSGETPSPPKAEVVPLPQKNAVADPDFRPDVGIFGMTLFLASLAVLFAASIVGYLVVRLKSEQWRPEELEGLPSGLWFATAVLLGASFCIHSALSSIKAENQGTLRQMMLATTLLGTLFLVLQGFNWWGLVRGHDAAHLNNLYAFTFFLLTGIHALHVIGGVIQLVVVTNKAFTGTYTADYHPGVTYSAMYWHFLDGVWLVLFVLLLVLS